MIAQSACQEICGLYKDTFGFGCMVIWDQENRGCYRYLNGPGMGSGDDKHLCWPNLKCSGNN